ncbi:MAG: ribosome biogenesis GTP-binding protein YihA/YsxC [Bacteroidales bacterium]
MEIKSAQFVISNTDIKKCPITKNKEYAFIGRSNVGKSSLINMLTARKGLAMTSSTPGKTQCVNHFIINDSWYIVDLPGYGYARCRKDLRERINKIVEDYVREREEMTLLFVLIDSRHTPQKIDLDFMRWLGENEVPFALIFTKGDKLGTERLKENIQHYKDELLKEWEELPTIFVTSSTNRNGREELLNYIETINGQK